MYSSDVNAIKDIINEGQQNPQNVEIVIQFWVPTDSRREPGLTLGPLLSYYSGPIAGVGEAADSGQGRKEEEKKKKKLSMIVIV